MIKQFLYCPGGRFYDGPIEAQKSNKVTTFTLKHDQPSPLKLRDPRRKSPFQHFIHLKSYYFISTPVKIDSIIIKC